jgi:hypothetical protein
MRRIERAGRRFASRRDEADGTAAETGNAAPELAPV